MDAMQTTLVYLKGVGPERARLLKEELNLRTFEDLLHFFPNRYIDRTRFYSINDIPRNNTEIQIKGKITSVNYIDQKRGKRMVASFEDETGQIELVWFRGYRWIRDQLKINESYIIFGRLNWFRGKASMPHPEIELESNFQKNTKISFYPIYPSTEKLINKGLSQKVVQKMVVQLIEKQKTPFSETLPTSLLNQYKLISKDEAIRQIHFPKNQHVLTRAQMRLKFEEFFYMQMQLVLKKVQRKQKIKGHEFKKVGSNFNNFFKLLPYNLTNAQKRVIKDIRFDMGTGRQMNRLLQGDVGSGKTIVALLLMLIALDNDYQACLIAPTEILAQQHYQSVVDQIKKLNITVALLTGSSVKKERQEIHHGLQNGELNILIGTHAVFEDKVQFKNLGLSIIDEQHRFGVAQRARIWKKNELPPHILVMTATPIPRTFAMSIYGDLDLSVINELPPGRKKIKTLHRTDSNRLKVFAFIKEQINIGKQVYVVYPLIQESSNLDYKDLMDGYASLSRSFPVPNYHISIVHGQMKSKDKVFEMERFIKGKTQIMVATTVIEVGVNVPNASVMIIESAERFGLSQLHQLRGRVGRGADQSYCILMTGSKISHEALTRMKTMSSSNDGFEIAEVDLKLRGPGNLMGTQQSGLLKFKIADLIKDHPLLKAAREETMRILELDPSLKIADHQCIKKTLAGLKFDSNIWNFIS
ncbi:MAG: ATP-dependent DNA helicase RecG [Flavobacteriaceae bacterium]|nr:ATP-dependent DNA helicase RecG [Flavobacteriaceae bacterium]